MSHTPLRSPNDRYSVAIDVLASRGGHAFTRHRATTGVPFWDVAGPGGKRRREQAAGPRPHSFLVVVDDKCSLVLIPGENGLTVRNVKLLNADRALITAMVTAGAGAPEWLPNEGTYVLFDGDRAAAATLGDRFTPLDGMAADRCAPEDGITPLDQLAVALGRSVARANASLARMRAEGGVALVSRVTIRVAVDQTDLGQGRVLVTLARPGQGQTGQFVEFTMTTVPGAEEEELEVGAGAQLEPGAELQAQPGMQAPAQPGAQAGRTAQPQQRTTGPSQPPPG